MRAGAAVPPRDPPLQGSRTPLFLSAGVAHEPPICGGVGGWRPLGEKYARVPCGGGGGSAATGPAPARLSDTAFLVQAQGRAVRWQIRAIVRGSVYRPPHVRPCHRATLPKGVKVVYVLPDTKGWAYEPPMCGGVGGWRPLGEKYARVPCGGGGGSAATGPAPARLSDTAFLVQAQGRAVRWQIRAIVRGSVYRPPHVRPCHRATLPKGVKVVYVLPVTIGGAYLFSKMEAYTWKNCTQPARHLRA